MAQNKSNTVNDLMSRRNAPSIVNPRNTFSTQTSTPTTNGMVDMKAATKGLTPGTPFNQSMIPGGQSRNPGMAGGSNSINFPALSALGVTARGSVPIPTKPQSYSPNTSSTHQPPVSSATPQFNQGGGSTFNSQLDSIKNQALDIQGKISQMGTPNATQSSAGNNQSNNGNQNFFPGVLNDLLGASNPTREQNRVRKEMERIAAGNKTIADQARAYSEKYANEIDRVGQLGAGAVAGNLSTGSNVVGSGNAAIASQSASTRMDALAKAQQAALEGTGQQLTGQQQMADALNPSLQASLTQQAQQLSGLNAAGTLAQPQQVPYSEQYLDPYTGQSAGGAGLGGYAGYNAAQQAISLAGQFPDANVQYDPNLTPEQNLQRVQQAIQGSPSYQKGTYGVPGQQSFAGAATANIAASGLAKATEDYFNIVKQKAYADNQVDALAGVMKQYGINENDVRKGNDIENYLRKQFGDEGVTAYQTALSEAQRAYSSLLTIGGGTIPSEATAASNVILSPNSTPGQIMSAVKQLKRAGDDRERAQGSQVQTYQNQLQTTQGRGGGNSFAEQW